MILLLKSCISSTHVYPEEGLTDASNLFSQFYTLLCGTLIPSAHSWKDLARPRDASDIGKAVSLEVVWSYTESKQGESCKGC